MREHSNDTLTGLVTIAPNVNLGDMKKLIEDIEGIPVSKTTIHRTLSELDFICGKPSEKPPVSPQIIEKRKHYCDMHQSDKFSNVPFWEESVLALFENRVLVWWRPGVDEMPIANQAFCKDKVMIGGGISRKRKTKLHYWRLDQKETVMP